MQPMLKYHEQPDTVRRNNATDNRPLVAYLLYKIQNDVVNLWGKIRPSYRGTIDDY